MKGKELGSWTADELLVELRLRERDAMARGAHGGERALGPVKRMGRSREMQGIPTKTLAKLARDRQRVIYGVDNRQDIYQVTLAKARVAAHSVAALVRSEDLARDDSGSYTLDTTSYQEQYRLCGNEPFASQRLGCFCTGFLVGLDVIATAGHCVDSQSALATIRFVFGFQMIDAASVRTNFSADDVYAGKKLLGRQLANDGTDWALVQLDRPVIGRKPLRVRASGKIGNTQSLFVIGHPCGLPQKYAPGARVRDNTPAPYFSANLDTYGGNSGSPVFNAGNGTVEGILVRGENDFVSNGTCNVSLVCPTTGCRGEDVTRSAVWVGKVPKTAADRAASASTGKHSAKRARKTAGGARR